jgi:hypothetical protein
LKERAERKVNKNRKAKFKRQLQTWLRVSNKSKVRVERREQNNSRGVKFKKKEQIWLKTCKRLENKAGGKKNELKK